MKHISRKMVARVLNEVESPFDAHMIERRILRLETVAVANELLEYQYTDTLQQFSAAFASWISRTFVGQIRKTRKVMSDNLGGRECANQEWVKTNPGTSIT
jgi:hypothetical protein